MPVIERPDPSQETDERLFEDDEDIAIMSPRELSPREAQGRTDVSNYPEELHRSLENMAESGTTLEINPEDLRRIEQIELAREEANDETKDALDNLTTAVNTKMDDLTETVDNTSKRELFMLENSSKLLGMIEQQGEEALDFEKEKFKYQQDKDFDDARPVDETVPVEITNEAAEDIEAQRNRRAQQGGGGLLDLLGLGAAGAAGGKAAGFLGKFARIAGILSGFGAALVLADSILRAFFGVDLIQIVTDGVKYLINNWDKVLKDIGNGLVDFVVNLPTYIGDAIEGLGEAIRNIIASIPGLGFLASGNGEKGGFASAADTAVGTGATVAGVGAVGAGVVAAKKAGIFERATSLFGRNDRESVSQRASTGVPESDNADSRKKPSRSSRFLGKFGKIATVAALGYTFLSGDDEPEQAQSQPATDMEGRPTLDDGRPVEMPREQIDAQADGLGTAELLGAAGVAGVAGTAYMRNRRAQRLQTAQPTNQPALPKPSPSSNADAEQRAAANRPDKPVRGGLLRRAGRLAGRIPGLSLLAAGADIFSTANDDELTQDEKNVQYAGAAGTLAGGAAGAALGATLGSVIPVAGTAVGGILGGIVGSFLGEEGVEALVSNFIGPEETEAGSIVDSGVGAGDGAKGFVERSPQEVNEMSPEEREFYRIEKQMFETAKASGLVDERGQIRSGTAVMANGIVVQRDGQPVGASSAVDYMPGTQEDLQNQIAKSVEEQVFGPSGAGRANFVEDIPVQLDGKQPVADSVQAFRTQEENLQPVIENVEPMLATETAGDNGETLASGPIEPNIVVEPVIQLPKQEPAPTVSRKPVREDKKPDGRRADNSGYSRSPFTGRPSLDNVPPMLTDLGVNILNMGYV
jgi:hypothetical protein